MWMHLLHTLLLSCDKVSELMDRRKAGVDSPTVRFQLWMHRGICAGCRAYEKQSAKLDELMERRHYTGSLDGHAMEERILLALASKADPTH